MVASAAKLAFSLGCLLGQQVTSCPSILNPQVVAESVATDRRLSAKDLVAQMPDVPADKGMLNSDVDPAVADMHFRRLTQQLAGSPTMSRNAFMNDGGQTIANKASGTKNTFDIMADLADKHKEDMCIFSMQQLPPPGADWNNAKGDFQKFADYGELAGQRFQDMMGADKHGGSALFGACVVGHSGAKALCAAGVNKTFTCSEKRKNQQMMWPQAATIFKINSKNKAAALANLKNWRSKMDQHLPMMGWVMKGGKPNEGGSKVNGWGQNGGLRAKVVPCSQIDKKYHYTTPRYTCDNIDANGQLMSDDLYKHWLSLCSVWPAGFKCPTTTTTTGSGTTNAPSTTSVPSSKKTTSGPSSKKTTSGGNQVSASGTSGVVFQTWLLLVAALATARK